MFSLDFFSLIIIVVAYPSYTIIAKYGKKLKWMYLRSSFTKKYIDDIFLIANKDDMKGL